MALQPRHLQDTVNRAPREEHHLGQQVQEVADQIVRIVDGAADALSSVSETTLCAGLQSAVQALASTLDILIGQLPVSRAECHEVFQNLGSSSSAVQQLARDADSLQAQARHLSQERDMVISADDFQEALQLVRSALVDVRTALVEVPRDELEELSEVALTVARMGMVSLQGVARQVKDAVDQDARSSSVVIEDLGEAPRQQHWRPSDGIRLSGQAPPRRLLWEPLWPRLQAWAASPSLPSLSVPLPSAWICAVAFLVLWPMLLLLFFLLLWAFLVAVPSVLLADAALQHIYLTRQATIDRWIEGPLQLARLWYLSARLAARRAIRVAKAQLNRALAGRSFSTAARDCWQHPGRSAMIAAQVAEKVVFGMARETWRLAKFTCVHFPAYVKATAENVKVAYAWLQA